MAILEPALKLVPVPSSFVFHPPKSNPFLENPLLLGSVILEPVFSVIGFGVVPVPPLTLKTIVDRLSSHVEKSTAKAERAKMIKILFITYSLEPQNIT